mgnify:CR=1 FL=1
MKKLIFAVILVMGLGGCDSAPRPDPVPLTKLECAGPMDSGNAALRQIDASDVSDLWADGDSEAERCQAALEKWMRGKAEPDRAKALRFLASRGFEFSDATEAVKAIFR